MGFISYLGTFVKRILFFIGGFIIAFPVAGSLFLADANSKIYNPPDIFQNPAPILGLVLLVIGWAAMFYAFKLKE